VSATVLFMSMSLDGFIAGPNEGPDNGLGDGGQRLHQWAPDPEPDRKVAFGQDVGANRRVYAEAMATGAVVAAAPSRVAAPLICRHLRRDSAPRSAGGPALVARLEGGGRRSLSISSCAAGGRARME
jgi:hypothetical protein